MQNEIKETLDAISDITQNLRSVHDYAMVLDSVIDLENNIHELLKSRVEMLTKLKEYEYKTEGLEKKVWSLSLINKDLIGFLEEEHEDFERLYQNNHGPSPHDPECETCLFIKRLKE